MYLEIAKFDIAPIVIQYRVTVTGMYELHQQHQGLPITSWVEFAQSKKFFPAGNKASIKGRLKHKHQRMDSFSYKTIFYQFQTKILPSKHRILFDRLGSRSIFKLVPHRISLSFLDHI